MYYIPDNFIEEGRIFQGAIRIRYLIEGIILSLIGIIPALLIKVDDLQVRITLVVFMGGPFLLAGLYGFNGDPLSVAFSAFKEWRKEKNILLYNKKAVFLTEAPIVANETGDPLKDKVIGVIENYQQKRTEARDSANYVEGETFEFADDKSLAGLSETDRDKIAEIIKSKEKNDGIITIDDEDNLDDLYSFESDYVDHASGPDTIEQDAYGFEYAESNVPTSF